jgi:hypothetical protein
MLRSIKFLPIIALAAALSPLAAQARGARTANQNATVYELTPSSATIDNPTTVYGGVNVNSFRDAVGG